MKKHITIVGGGSAGWMTAMIMMRSWANKNIHITLLESAEVATIGVGEGSTPALKNFFEKMDISEQEWMPACSATYKCGITFSNWSTRPGFEHYYHPFPSVIDNHSLPIFMHNAQARLGGADVYAHPDRFFLSAHLAKNNLAPRAHYNFPFDVQYGYHFDAVLLGKFLRVKAISLGVEHKQCHVQQVLRKDNGDIASLVTNDNQTLEADFFVDCSGFTSLLLQKALQVPFVSYRHQLFNDAAVALPSPIFTNSDPGQQKVIPSQTCSTALRNGWAWKIPLTNRFGNGYVYSSDFCSADEAECELREHLDLLDADISARHLPMKVGRVAEHWVRNCVAVGLSQGFIEPLEATALFLIQQTAAIFVQLYERGNFTNLHQAEFNQRINAQFDGTRDYIITHYKTSSRSDTEYWRANTADPENISDSLRALYHCWMTGKDLAAEIRKQDLARFYPASSWYCIFSGMGIFPERARLRAPEAIEKRFDLDDMDDFLARCLLNFDDHHSFLFALQR